MLVSCRHSRDDSRDEFGFAALEGSAAIHLPGRLRPLICRGQRSRMGYVIKHKVQMTGGLTGGMACGKSTAAAYFAEEGFGLVDSDELVHQLLASDDGVIGEVKGRFGPEMILPGGGVDRRKLGAIVFSDPEELDWLERLLHPLVREEWRRRVAGDAGRPWIVQIPLLFEKKLESSFDFTVCISADSELQFQRLEARGLSKEDVAGRISRQLPLARKIELADHHLHNNGSLEFLRAQVQHLAALLRRRFQPETTPDII